MDTFIRELESDKVHLRDKWQVELKSEFFPQSNRKKNKYTQEFYIFIPNSLQINEHTYGKNDFFRDQTTFIRYKTPVFNINELIDRENEKSPLFRLEKLIHSNYQESVGETICQELKLLGNIVRSGLRKRVFFLYKLLTPENIESNDKLFLKDVQSLKNELESFRMRTIELHAALFDGELSYGIDFSTQFQYVDEFISNSIHHYLSGLLAMLRNKNPDGELIKADNIISEILLDETEHRERIFPQQEKIKQTLRDFTDEFIFYRASLLGKFVLDGLRLNISRSSPDKQVNNIVGAFAAGLAMFIYFSLFIWQSEMLFVKTELFILITVILYIIKDRMKESIKNFSFRFAFRYLPDYRTKIHSAENSTELGLLKEYFSFLKPDDLSEEVSRVRNREFHNILEKIRRPEMVIHYKRSIEMFNSEKNERMHGLNVIFRFNFTRFLEKADNPYHSLYNIDPISKELTLHRLPKTYHINIILKNSYLTKKGREKSQIHKIRLIVDKNGIKRVEQVVH